MNFRNNFSLFTCILLAQNLLGQSDLDRRYILVVDSCYTAQGKILQHSDNPTSRRLRYTYYYKNQIFSSNGGYHGYLLDGTWVWHDLQNRLYKKGAYCSGLRDGVWVSWFPDGRIQKMESWKKGRQHGVFRTYDQNGSIVQKGRFNKGRPCGIWITNNGSNVPAKQFYGYYPLNLIKFKKKK
jgi:hypothetical protein